MMPRSVKPLTEHDLANLPTPRLLRFLRKLQQCENNLEESDWLPENIAKTDGLIFKSSVQWQAQYKLVKSILNTRKNVEG